MTRSDLTEATTILNTLLDALLGTLAGNESGYGTIFRYAVGDLRASGQAQIAAGTLGLPLLNCFMAAFYAGATVADMEVVRLSMASLTPAGLPGIAVANAGIRFALGREARILANTTFSSSDDVFTALTSVNGAFEQAEEFAADNRDPSTFQALIGMHAAVVRDLTTRACALPRLVTYEFPKAMTSHALANRIYGDASRCDELRAENGVIHPAFMPPAGTCLSE